MAKKAGGIAAYNAIIGAIKARTGVTHREAQQAYRSSSVRLGRAPTLNDAKRSAAVKAEAGKAGAQLRAKAVEKMRATERAIERARQPRRSLRDKSAVNLKPPTRRGGRDDGGGGGGGLGGRAGGGSRRPVDYDEPLDLEPPDNMEGEDEDSPVG